MMGAGFADGSTAMFFVNPPGQHDRFPVGGDRDESPGTEQAGGGSTAQAAVGGAIGAVVGLATLPVLGPGAAVAAAGVGAYGGSLYGALHNTNGAINNGATPAQQAAGPKGEHRHAGIVVAVAAPTPAQQATAARILRKHAAVDVEASDGTIVAGEWVDFDPLKSLALLANQRVCGRA